MIASFRRMSWERGEMKFTSVRIAVLAVAAALWASPIPAKQVSVSHGNGQTYIVKGNNHGRDKPSGKPDRPGRPDGKVNAPSAPRGFPSFWSLFGMFDLWNDWADDWANDWED